MRFYSSDNHKKNPPFSFPLCSIVEINELTGMSGVYIIVNNLAPSEFYIGSSVNLGRRLLDYYYISLDIRSPETRFERIIKTTNIEGWTIVILAYVAPSLVLVEEQLAICTFRPTLNTNYSVMINYWLANFDFASAISLAIEYRNLFVENSANYLEFSRMILIYTNAKSATLVTQELITGTPVFVYNWQTGETVAVYSSIKAVMRSMHLSTLTLIKRMDNKEVHTTRSGQQVVFSKTALTPEEVNSYTLKVKTRREQMVSLTDTKGNTVQEYPTVQAFCIANGLTSHRFRRILSQGITEFNGLTIVLTERSQIIPVYCYDPHTHLQVAHFVSIRAAFKSVEGKIGYKGLQNLINSNGLYNGLIYSYSSTYPF